MKSTTQTMRLITCLLFVLLCFSPFISKSQFTFANAATETIPACGTGTITINLTNLTNNPINLSNTAIPVYVNFGTTAVTFLSSPAPTITRGPGVTTTTTPTLYVSLGASPGQGVGLFNITGSGTIPVNGVIALKYYAIANCSLLEGAAPSAGDPNCLGYSFPPVPATIPQFGGNINNFNLYPQYGNTNTAYTTPTNNAVQLTFAYLTPSLAANGVAPPACFGTNQYPFGQNLAGNGYPAYDLTYPTIIDQSFQNLTLFPSIPNPVYRAITITNSSTTTNFTFGTLIINDVRTQPGLKVTSLAIPNSSNTALTIIATNSSSYLTSLNTTDDQITINSTLYHTITGNTSLAAGTSFTFYEELTPTVGAANPVCNDLPNGIQSTISCSWTCSTTYETNPNPGFCLNTIVAGNLIFPSLNPILATTITDNPLNGAGTASVNTCYNTNSSLTFANQTPTRNYTMTLQNNGNSPASSVTLTFQQPNGVINAWTDFDFNEIYNQIVNSTNPSSPIFTLTNSAGTQPIFQSDISTVTGSWSNASTPTVPISTNRSITFTFIPSLKLYPGDYITATWNSYTFVPTIPLCQANTMDQWLVYGTYQGNCDGSLGYINNHVSPGKVIESSGNDVVGTTTIIENTGSTTTNSQNMLTPVGPATMVGHFSPSGFVFNAPQGVYTCQFPETVYSTAPGNPFWPYIVNNMSFVVTIELGSDIKIFNSLLPANNTTPGEADQNLSYQPTGFLQNVLFTDGNGNQITPSCITYICDGNCGSGFNGTVSANGRNMIEARFDVGINGVTVNSFNYNATSLVHASVSLNLEPHCDLNTALDDGNDPLNITIYEVPNNTCASVAGACQSIQSNGVSTDIGNKIPLACANTMIQVVCPGCQIAGIYSNGNNYSFRETYGLLDANEDGFADGTGTAIVANIDGSFSSTNTSTLLTPVPYLQNSLAPGTVQTSEMMYSDVFRVRTLTYVLAGINNFPDLAALGDLNGTPPNQPAGFPYAYARVNFSSGGSPALANPINDITAFDDGNLNRYVEVRWWLNSSSAPGSSIPQWSNPIYISLGSNSVMAKLTSTGEYCYQIAASDIYAGDNSFPGIIDGMNLAIDFNYQVTGNVGPGTPYPVTVQSKVYGALRTENFSTPSSWLVELQNDPNFGDPAWLTSLCPPSGSNITSPLPITEQSVYATGIGANTTVNSCDDVRWYCVPGQSSITLAGYSWTPCVPNFYPMFVTSCNFDARGARTLEIGHTNSVNSNEFLNEYRNWTYPNKNEFYTLFPVEVPYASPFIGYHIVSNSEPAGAGTFTYQYSTHSNIDQSPSVITTAFNIQPYSYINLASNIYYTNNQYTQYNYNSLYRPMPDDGYYTLEGFAMGLPCGWTPFNLSLRSSDYFPSNNLSEVFHPGGIPTSVTSPVGSLIGIVNNFSTNSAPVLTSHLNAAYAAYPPTANSPNILYNDDTVWVRPSTNVPVMSATTAGGIASCGTVSWTETVEVQQQNFHMGQGSNGLNFVVNPFIGFQNITGWNITGVELNGVPMVFDPILNVWLLQSSAQIPSGLTGSPPPFNDWYSWYNGTNSQPSQRLTNTVQITATYCPYITPLPTTGPTVYAGQLCDVFGMRADIGAATGQAAALWTIQNSCITPASNVLGVTYQEPVLAVADNSNFSGISLCSSSSGTIQYVISNPAFGDLGTVAVDINTTGSNYTISGPATVVSSTGTYTNVAITSGSPLSLTPYLQSGELEGAQVAGPGSPLSTVTIIIPISTITCSAPNSTGITGSVTALDACNQPSNVICPNAPSYLFGPNTYNPLYCGPNASINMGITSQLPGSPITGIDNGCYATYTIPISIQLPTPGTSCNNPPPILANNYLHFFVPTGFSISTAANAVQFNGVSLGLTSTYSSSTYVEVGTTNEYIYNIPAGSSSGSMLVVTLESNQTSPYGEFCGGIFNTQIHSVNCSVTCDQNLEQMESVILSPAQISIVNNGSCTTAQTLTAGVGCSAYTYQWSQTTGGSTTALSSTGSTITPTGAGTYNVTVTAPGCTSAATASIIVYSSVQCLSLSLSVALVQGEYTCDYGKSVFTVIANGGGTTDTYEWNNGTTIFTTNSNTYSMNALDLSPPTYSLTVTDLTLGGLSTSINFNTSRPSASSGGLPCLYIAYSSSNPCGSPTTVTANVTEGTPQYQYLWYDLSTNLQAGTGPSISINNTDVYSVTVTDAMGYVVSENTILIPSMAGVLYGEIIGTCSSVAYGIINLQVESAINGALFPNPPYTYLWNNLPAGAVTNPSSPNEEDDLSAGGPYNATVTDGNGCIFYGQYTVPSAMCKTGNSQTDSIQIGTTENKLDLEPNPATDMVLVNYSISDIPNQCSIKVYDVLGQLINSIMIPNSSGQLNINLLGYAPGAYTLTLENNHNKIQTKRLIKE